jgi:hypothetical protein
MRSETELTKVDALRAYARMMHHLSADYLAPLLANDFHYASQWVFEEITNKQQYLDYIRPKLEVIKASGNRVWAELAELQTYPGGPCLVMAQGDKSNISATVIVEVSGSKIKRLDMCFVPSPQNARRTGEYPE